MLQGTLGSVIGLAKKNQTATSKIKDSDSSARHHTLGDKVQNLIRFGALFARSALGYCLFRPWIQEDIVGFLVATVSGGSIMPISYFLILWVC